MRGNPKTFAKKLKLAIAKTGLSLHELEEATKVPHKKLGRWCRAGIQRPKQKPSRARGHHKEGSVWALFDHLGIGDWRSLWEEEKKGEKSWVSMAGELAELWEKHDVADHHDYVIKHITRQHNQAIAIDRLLTERKDLTKDKSFLHLQEIADNWRGLSAQAYYDRLVAHLENQDELARATLAKIKADPELWEDVLQRLPLPRDPEMFISKFQDEHSEAWQKITTYYKANSQDSEFDTLEDEVASYLQNGQPPEEVADMLLNFASKIEAGSPEEAAPEVDLRGFSPKALALGRTRFDPKGYKSDDEVLDYMQQAHWEPGKL